MKKIGRCILLFSSSLLISCGSRPTSPDERKKAHAFHRFIQEFRHLPLPVFLNPKEVENNSYNSLSVADTAFIKEPSSFAFGLLGDTSHFYAILTLTVGDSYVPVLTTFDKRGNRIDSRWLLVGTCPGGPGVESCSSQGTIGTDFEVHCRDSTRFSDVDSNARIIPGTKTALVHHQDGKIDANGFIRLGEQKSKNHVQ